MHTSFTPDGQFDYMFQKPNAQMPNPQDSATLPMFSPQNGFSDNGVDTTTGTDGENAAD
jgi:hypothetical protein